MKWMKKRPGEPETSYWETISDIMSTLLLILLLIIVLLVIYVVRVPQNDNIDMWEGDTYNEFANNDVGHNDNQPGNDERWNGIYWERKHDNDDGGGGGGGWGGGGTDHEGTGDGLGDFQYPDFGIGDYEGMEKAAVYVIVLDGETRRTIKEAGVTFSVFDHEGEQITLNTYYPQLIAFRDFETTDMGVFYLPEKVPLGGYTLHEITEPYGYDAAENQAFHIDESHDWDEPYMIEVPLFPSRNVIRIQTTDSMTGQAVAGGAYDVVAATDIVTMDGTLRYNVGQVVDRITCDETGMGMSKELYLGEYIVRQTEAPEYYVQLTEDLEVTVAKRTPGVMPAAHAMACERTVYTLRASDELYNNIGVAGAAFSLMADGAAGSQMFLTDGDGVIELNTLRKNTAYHLRQVSTPEGYSFGGETVSFLVTGDGRIDGLARAEGAVHNRMLRISVGVRDLVLRGLVSDYNVVLYDHRGELVKVWSSTGMAYPLEGLAAGNYHLTVTGGGQVETDFTVEDVPEIQRFDVEVWTTGSVAAVAGLTLGTCGLIAFLAALLIRRRRK